MARPTRYTRKVAEEICQRISDGQSLRSVCKDSSMPHRTTIHGWLLEEDKKDFLELYQHAMNVRAETMFDELEEIADNSKNDFMEREGLIVLHPESIQRSRLRVDTRKWYLSKIMPKKFGDRSVVTTEDEEGNVQPINGIVINNPNDKREDSTD